ncbi:MAG: hypothetical protein HYX20_03925 [Candidatus Yanofskybacteria bacterium]|nr:hypothetical protein [Candidatus Yanofskybacteria bacterium]
MSKKGNKFGVLLAVIILLAVFVPQYQARADLFDIGSIASGAVAKVVGYINTLLLGFLGEVISYFAQLIEEFITLQTNGGIYNVAIVDGSWTIIRNFVNLFFILALIVMAFGTIFNIQRYTWKNMLAPFLIAALLINFSLTIGQYIITVANGLATVFLREMQDPQVGGIAANFQNGFSSAKIITSGTTSISALQAMGDAAAGIGSVVLTLIFSVIFLAAIALAFIATAIFSIVRLFMLWFLLIISPIAWFGYTMPNLRSGTWSAWWKQFLCWCFFLPYFLFFMMFAVSFIKNKGLISLPSTLGRISVAGMTGNDFVFYLLSLIFLFGGMAIAHKLACASGTGVKAVFGKIETGVRKYAPGAAYVRATYTGAKEGLAAKGAEIKERGMPIGFGRRVGGEQAERLRTARVAEAFGMGAKVGEAGRVQMAEIEKEAKRVREQLLRTPADQQKSFLESSRSQKGVIGQAAALEYVKQGYSTLADYQEAVKKFGDENSAFMRQYLENLKQAKLSDLFKSPDAELRIARGEAEETVGLVNLRRELYKDLAKRNRINNTADYNQAKEILSPIPAELRSFLDSVKAEAIFTTREQRQDALLDSTNKIGDADLEKKLVEFMKEKKEITDFRKKDTKELVAAGWQLREKALEILGGKETFDGKGLIKEINNYNPIINIEAEMRTAPGAKPFLDNEELISKLQEELKGKSYADIRKMSGKFFEDPAAQEAIKRMYDPKEIADLIKNSSQEMRRALKDFAISEEKTKRSRT